MKAIVSEDRRIWLASKSPRRRSLLANLGFEPVVRASDVPEFPGEGEGPIEYTERLATDKGRAVRDGLGEQDRAEGPGWVLAADTIVLADGLILEKPADEADAVRLLTMLGGREHRVVTSFWLGSVNGVVEHVRSVQTHVRFRTLTAAEIEGYVATGEPMDKAGAYGIQGIGGFLVEGIRGSYFNVVGLPTTEVLMALRHVKALPTFPFS